MPRRQGTRQSLCHRHLPVPLTFFFAESQVSTRQSFAECLKNSTWQRGLCRHIVCHVRLGGTRQSLCRVFFLYFFFSTANVLSENLAWSPQGNRPCYAMDAKTGSHGASNRASRWLCTIVKSECTDEQPEVTPGSGNCSIQAPGSWTAVLKSLKVDATALIRPFTLVEAYAQYITWNASAIWKQKCTKSNRCRGRSTYYREWTWESAVSNSLKTADSNADNQVDFLVFPQRLELALMFDVPLSTYL